MAKIIVDSTLTNITEGKFFSCNARGIYKDNKIKYVDNDVTVVIDLIPESIIITRRSKEYEIVMPLINNSKSKGKYTIKNLGVLDVSIETKNLIITQDKLITEYSIQFENDKKTKFKFCLNFREEEK